MAVKNNKTTKKKQELPVDTKAAVQALEYLLAAGYVNKKRLYVENFLRGIFFSAGSIIGAAVVVTLLLWILSLFDGLPFIRDISQAVESTIESR